MYTSAHNNDPEQRETDTTHFNYNNEEQQQQHAQHGYSYNDDDDDDDRHAERGAGLSGANGDVSAFRLDGDEADGDDDGEMGGEEEERGWKRKPKRAQKRAVAKELKRKERRAGDQEGDEDDGDDEERDEESGIQSGPLMGLPLETLARIFAHLDPVSLARCAAVCQTFAAVARDDATWRQAFSVHFHIERRASGLGGGDDTTTTTTPVLRRLDASSWKQEYTKRTELLRQWRKAKSPTVISDARVSTIDAVAVSLPHHFMLSASLTYGVASRCDPFTGKVAKGFVDAAGQVNGAGFGPMAVDPSLDISSVALESDASRIVWGFHSGQVGMTVLQKQGTNPRGAIKATRFSDRGCHAGPVLDIALPFGTGRGGAHSIERKPERLKQRQAALGEVAETFVTAGLDGTVRLWSPRRSLPVWTALALPKREGPHRPTPVVCVDYDVGSGSIAAGTSEGDVVVWTAIDVDALLRLPATAWDHVLVASSQDDEVPSVVQARATLQRIQSSVVKVMLGRTRSAAPSGATKAISQLILDVDPSAESALVRLLVLGKGAHAFERIDISFNQAVVSGGAHDVQRAIFENPAESEVTSLRPDFDLAPRRTPRSFATPTSPSLGQASSGANHHHLVLGPSPDSSPSPEAALFAERKYVCAGTKNGRVVFWDWRNRLGDDETFVPASLSLDAHHTSITALDLTEHVVIVGCSDGTIKAFCPLTGSLVRTFNDRTATRHPARMLAAGELSDDEASRFVVTSLVAGTETVVAAIGAQVLAWRAEKVKSSGGNKRGPRSSSGTPKLGARTASGRHWQSQREMEHDVYETKAQLQAEQESRQASYERYRYAVGPPEIGGLSEQEAFEYAMMLSRDEEEARRRQGAAAGTSAFPRRLAENVGKGKQRSDAQEEEEGPIDWELEDALEQIALAESRPRTRQTSDEEGDAAAAGHNSTTSPSPSPSPMSSPPLGGISTPSRAWDILNNAGSLARASQQGEERWRPNNKVRTVNVPRAARLSSGAAASLSSMENGPLGGSSSSSSLRRGSHTGANNVNWSSPTDFPAFSSPSGPASLAASPGAGMGAGSLPGSHPRPQGAWAQGSPALRPAASSFSSSSAGLSASRPSFSPLPPPKSPVGGQQGNPSPPPARPSEAMDDDLRFAIELSLAEARSKS
ncbi:hypothetical protein FA10DRAFT_289217 [Acaromyces ingoldii]|uniref:F-box domain-containing protein n=1 Tax=Acaromyces ingoldii TaxID=215250 RepID=A0A316YHC0_9BASI|nr:hypothetical protein FA10DRAFT_289217 [Acaromyces ingoldii]PWN87145.1 hypothetical protein FA10DRAFT_289217 [Acaromyces ingoldii]